MVVGTIALALAFTLQADATQKEKPDRLKLDQPAAEVVTLRDGSTILGQILSVPQPTKGSGKGAGNFGAKGVQPIVVLVRRSWAEAHQKERLTAWVKGAEPELRRNLDRERHRLELWRKERSHGLSAEQKSTDRILSWIDGEIERISAPGSVSRWPLMLVKLPRGEVKSLDRKPAAVSRLLALAWLCDLPEPENMTADQLKEGIAGRGLVADTSRPVALDGLLPPVTENEAHWLARRAATEVTVDPDLRFIRFQDFVLPDSKEIQSIDQIGIASGLSGLKNLLNPEENRQDPLVEKFEKIEASGRSGALVTHLTISPDFASASVEITLWVKAGARKWLPAGSETATTRTEELGADAGKELADDPQVQSAFKIAEALGLGQVVGDLKQRSLRIGAATQRALGQARSASETSLDTLAFPVFKPDPKVKRADDASGPANPSKDSKPRK